MSEVQMSQRPADAPIVFTPVGRLHTPYHTRADMPIQAAASNTRARLEVYPEFQGGLKDLDGFSHLILLYYFHQHGTLKLQVKPFLDESTQGVFAVRAPNRPNSIGLSVVKLVSLEANILEIEGADMLDGTPVLDIKPYIPAFDAPPGHVRVGWLENRLDDLADTRSDHRFH